MHNNNKSSLRTWGAALVMTAMVSMTFQVQAADVQRRSHPSVPTAKPQKAPASRQKPHHYDKTHRDAVQQDRDRISRLSQQGKIEAARAILKPYVDKGQVMEVVNRLDLSSPYNRGYLWSGDKEGFKKIVAQRHGVSLELTWGGRVVDNWPYLDQKFVWKEGPIRSDGEQFWGETSRRFAKGLTGSVTALQTPEKKGGGFIFTKYEYPELLRLIQKRKVNHFHAEVIDTKTITP